VRKKLILVNQEHSVYKQMYEFLDGLLRHKSDMVNIEAARALTEVKIIDQATLYRPVAGEHGGNGYLT
jgi:coatomer protein complex subunit gamma